MLSCASWVHMTAAEQQEIVSVSMSFFVLCLIIQCITRVRTKGKCPTFFFIGICPFLSVRSLSGSFGRHEPTTSRMTQSFFFFHFAAKDASVQQQHSLLPRRGSRADLCLLTFVSPPNGSPEQTNFHGGRRRNFGISIISFSLVCSK